MSRHLPPVPMLPGPVSVPGAVLDALRKNHGAGRRETEFTPYYNETSGRLAQILGTKNDVVIMTGEGMLALWAALKSPLRPGDRVLSVSTGIFGDGIGDMAASFGCEVRKLSLPFNASLVDLNPLADMIRAFKPKMITAVHCETPSGTINPLEGLGALKKDMGVPLLYVDAVSSIGGMPVNADACHVDLLLGGSQKCLSAPPSMCFMAVSENAWEHVRAVNYQGYDALLPFKEMERTGLHPYTPYWHGMAALNAAAKLLLDEGLEHVYQRHENAARQCRAGLVELGVQLWPAPDAVPSPTVTAALIPEAVAWEDWYTRLRERGLGITGNFGPMEGKVFRLGHMGSQADAGMVEKALEIISDALKA